MAVKIVYTPAGGSQTTLTFKRGPLNFKPYWDAAVHDNQSTSGKVRERVVEALVVMIQFDMPHLLLQDDMAAWAAFEAFALAGGQFQLYPSDGLPDNYNCVLEDTKFDMARNAPQKYGATVLIRCLNDGTQPSGPDVVLRRFYGLSS